MTIADFTPVSSFTQFSPARGLHAIIGWVAARRAARAKRDALQSLLFAPEHRLRDIGITREQLIRQIEAQGSSVRATEMAIQQ
jgi:uncharacterized protein YjiS (DUF1127 family)